MTMQLVPRVNIGNMHLDDRPFESLERVEHRNRRECESCRVDNDRISLISRGLNEIDQSFFVVRLMKQQLGACGLRKLLTACLDCGKRRQAVNVWLTHAEKIEARAIQNHQPRRHRLLRLETTTKSKSTANGCQFPTTRSTMWSRLMVVPRLRSEADRSQQGRSILRHPP